MNYEEDKKFIYALRTLLFTWGGDTPPEAIWAANDFIDFYNYSTTSKVPHLLEDHSNMEEVMKNFEN